MAEGDPAEDIRQVALILASEDLDDVAAEESVSEAMWLIKEPSAREELSGSLGIDVGEYMLRSTSTLSESGWHGTWYLGLFS